MINIFDEATDSDQPPASKNVYQITTSGAARSRRTAGCGRAPGRGTAGRRGACGTRRAAGSHEIGEVGIE